MIKILWIEDKALVHYAAVVGPLLVAGDYLLKVATDATAAIRIMRTAQYDVVIVDIRIGPGDAGEWIELYNAGGGSPAAARLGLRLLGRLLGGEGPPISIPWLRPELVGVLTVEPWAELKQDLSRLGVGVYRQKSTQTSRRQLVELVEEVLRRNGERDPKS